MRLKSEMHNKFINFYPINNCNFTVEHKIPGSVIEMLPYQHEKLDHIFYQKIYSEELYSNSISGEFIFTFQENVNTSDKYECLYYLSSYYIENNNALFDTSLILGEGFPQTFLFNENNSEIKYSFYFIGNNYSDINISVYLLNEGKYNLSLFINEVQIKDILILNRSRIIQIKYIDWKDIFNNNIEICRLSFIIISENLNENKFIKIYINFDLEIDDDESEEENKDEDESEQESEEENKDEDEKIIIKKLIIIIR